MKTGLFAVAAISLLQLAAAQPHGHRHRHARRDIVTDIVTVTTPEVIVWVDAEGHTFSVETEAATAQTAAPAPQRAAQNEPAPAIPSPTYAPAQAYVLPAASSALSSQAPSAPTSARAATSAPPASSTAPSPSPSPSAHSSGGSNTGSTLGVGVGITYSPYNGDGTCKSQDQVNSDFGTLNGYQIVRIYGVDCNQVSTVLSAARSKGMKIFAGLIDISNVSGNLQTMISAVNGDWSSIDTVAIGNELVNTAKNSVGDVVNALNTARGILKGAGFSGSVVTVDTFEAMIANPELCTASDYCAANCHAFFDPNTQAANAGDFVLSQAQKVAAAAGGKNTVITESGWPSQGSTNGQAVPSQHNQQAAIASLKAKFSGNLFLFNAFNDLWKTNSAGTFGAEQYWGIYGTSSS